MKGWVSITGNAQNGERMGASELSGRAYEPSGLEGVARDAALSNDGLQGADSDFGMILNRGRYGSTIGTPLHDDMTPSLPDDLESMLFKNAAHVPAGKGAELTHAPLQSG